MSSAEQLKKLIELNTRRLHVLQLQQAQFGNSAPPHIVLEIEDLEKELSQLKQQLLEAADNPMPADQPAAAGHLAGSAPPPPSGIVFNVGQGGSVNLGNLIGGSVGGDIIGGDKVAGDKVGGDKITTYGASPGDLAAALAHWKQEIEAKIAALTDLDEGEKEDLREDVAKVEQEAIKGEAANPGKITRLLNSMAAMAPDILEVTIAILKNPFAGVGLVLEKINDRIQVEQRK